MVPVADLKAAFNQVAALAEAIRMAGEGGIPSGHLYAMVMGKMSAIGYQGAISILVKAKLVKQGPMHLLTWIGPEITDPERELGDPRRT